MLDFLELQKEGGGKRGFLFFAIGPLMKYILKKQLKKRLLNNKVFLFFLNLLAGIIFNFMIMCFYSELHFQQLAFYLLA